MRRPAAAIGTFLFFWLAPGMVAGYVPWAITRWHARPPFLGISALRWVGAVLIAAGAAIVIESFARFAIRGRGTPAPVAPTEYLVVSGAYRYVRNPMYVGVLAAIVGQALVFGSARLLLYAAAAWAVVTAFVMAYEEPAMARQFGADYAAYRANVRRWWPRLTPWTPSPGGRTA